MSELSQQELAEFFNLFTALSAKNLQRLSSIPVDANKSQAPTNSATRSEDLISSSPVELDVGKVISTPSFQAESQVESRSSTTVEVTRESLEYLWDKYTRFVMHIDLCVRRLTSSNQFL